MHIVMMAQPTHAPVIGREFMVPYETDVIVNRCPSGYLEITDTQDGILFTVRPCDTTLHHQRLMQDKEGKPIATLRAKKRTAHGRWNAFRGKSIAVKDMIFSAARNNIIRINQTHVNVSLANEMGCGDDCDFQMKGGWSNRNCSICKGDSSTIVAQMRVGQSPERFKVTIYPNLDYAFVVALIAIVDAMKSPGTMKVAGQVATNIGTGAVSAVVVATQCFGGAPIS